MALRLGAKPAGQWSGAHVTPIDLESPAAESGSAYNRYSYPFGISVNANGQRFFDEGEALSSYTYAKTGWAVLRQPDSVAHQVFDQAGMAYVRRAQYDASTATVADTLPELATRLDIGASALVSTVDDFNRSIDESRPFDPLRPDGRATTGIQPPKSNWAVAIAAPRFRSYSVTAGITFTFGGLAINTDAEVLSGLGKPIPRLFASGDVIGLFHENYPAGTGQTRNAVFSRIAGKNAASMARSPVADEITHAAPALRQA